MSLIDTIFTRRSVRRYEQKEIPSDVLEKIIEAGRQAPSAANMQPIRFIIVNNHEIMKKMSIPIDEKELDDELLEVLKNSKDMGEA